MVSKAKNGQATKARKKVEEFESTQIKIQPLNIGKITFALRGISPLVTSAFGPKSRTQMLENQTRSTGTKAKKQPRCPEEEFIEAFYVVRGNIPEPQINEETKQKTYDPKVVAKFLKDSVFGVPAVGFKNALVSACRQTEYRMTELKQYVPGVYGANNIDPNFCLIESKSLPIMDSRICRLQGKNRPPVERFRPMWMEWSTKVTVEYDRNSLQAEEIANLLAIAGAFVGLCEGRPERCGLGWGRWELV